MAVINYQNLPDTSTPLNASNLNSMQENLPKILTFAINSNSSKTINFSNANHLVIFSSKAGIGRATELWIIGTYGEGGSTRTDINQLQTSSVQERALTYTISGQTVVITNPTASAASCSILNLVGSFNGVSVT